MCVCMVHGASHRGAIHTLSGLDLSVANSSSTYTYRDATNTHSPLHTHTHLVV